MTKIYFIDSDQLAVLDRVKSRLYNEMQRLTADDRRDLANAMDAVLYHVKQYGEATDAACTSPCVDNTCPVHGITATRG